MTDYTDGIEKTDTGYIKVTTLFDSDYEEYLYSEEIKAKAEKMNKGKERTENEIHGM